MESPRDPIIQLYTGQHGRALQHAGEIAALLTSSEGLDIHANQIRLLLAQLSGVLKPHFSSEDRLLYPALLANADPNVAETARRFWTEMGGITEDVNAFMDRWRKAGEIESDPAAFTGDCQAIFTALKTRVDAEEKELYPLFLKNKF